MDFIEIKGILVDKAILTTNFCCDYAECHGACCYTGNSPYYMGGILTSDEKDNIWDNVSNIAGYCDDDTRRAVLRKPTEEDNGKYFTSLRNGKCVLCNQTYGSCALKLIDPCLGNFDIPDSCALYPIVEYSDEGRTCLILEDRFGKMCECAYRKGERENISLVEFVKDAICRIYGSEFYETLLSYKKCLE